MWEEKRECVEILLKGMKYCIEFSGKKSDPMNREKDVIKLKENKKETKQTDRVHSFRIISFFFVLFWFFFFSRSATTVYLPRESCECVSVWIDR